MEEYKKGKKTKETYPEKTLHLYPELIQYLASKQVVAPFKSFNGRTEFQQAIEHSRLPGKREKTVLVWN